MTVACRHLLRELFTTFLLTSAVLLLVAVGGRFLGYLQDAALGKYGAEAVLFMIALRLPEFLALTLPLSFYVACVLAVSRAHADHETTALWAAGTSPLRYYLWIGAAGLLVATLVAVLSLGLTPAANARFSEFVAAERMRQAIAAMTPGVFHSERGGRAVTYAESVLPETYELRGVFIAQFVPERADVVVWAERGAQFFTERTGTRYLRLESGRRYEGSAGAMAVRVIEFGTLSQRLDTDNRRVVRRGDESRGTHQIDWGSASGAAELHWRIALPLMCLVGAVLAVGIARVGPREGRFARVPPALLLFFIYYVALLLNQSLVAEGHVAPAIGFWGVHAAFVLLALWLSRRFRAPLAQHAR